MVKKGYKQTEEHRKNVSLSLIGNKNRLGHKHSEETRKKMSLIRKGVSKTEKCKQNMSISHLNRTEEEKNDFIKNMLKNRKMSENEGILNDIILKNNLPFNYVGDGQVVLNGFCPDFLSKNPKQIIELFGDRHYDQKSKIRDKRRLISYSSLGYKTLIINNWELNNERKVIDKIKNFINQK